MLETIKKYSAGVQLSVSEQIQNLNLQNFVLYPYLSTKPMLHLEEYGVIFPVYFGLF